MQDKKPTQEFKPPVLDNNDQHVLYSIAHGKIINETISKEQAWFEASVYLLKKLGYKVVPNEGQ